MSPPINNLNERWQVSNLWSTTITKLRCYGPSFVVSMVPILSWLPKYTTKYLIGDIISGLTVGIMLVPQSLAYAKLANLPVQYGLYSGFFGTLMYCLTGSSREILVGPTGVLSLVVGKAISRIGAEGEFTNEEVAITSAFLMGVVGLAIGLLRLGAVFELIPMPVILGFTTGSAYAIILTQIPNLFGIPGVSTNQSNPLIISNIVTSVPKIKYLNLILGLSSVAFIYLFNFTTLKLMKKYPRVKYLKSSVNGIAVALFTLITFLVFTSNPAVDILMIRDVPSGFASVKVPNLNMNLVSQILPDLAPMLIVATLEHISVAKLFSRQVGYQANSSQEVLTLGIINTFSSFFSAFPSTGSFSRSAVLANSGVQTPLASAFSSIIVLLALTVLTPAFYFIPNACLSAIIVISSLHLVMGLDKLKQLTKSNPTDGLVVVVSGLTTFLAGSVLGIAVAVGLSFLILLYKLSRPSLKLLIPADSTMDVFIAQPRHLQTNSPTPGILIFKPSTWLIFPNIEYVKDSIMDSTLLLTRSPASKSAINNATKLWSDDLSSKGEKLRTQKSKLLGEPLQCLEDIPYLRGIIVDLGNATYIDASGLQGLVDLRDTLTKYAGCELDGTIKDEPELSSALKDNDFELNITTKKDILDIKPRRFDLIFVTVNPTVIEQLSKSGLIYIIPSITEPKINRSHRCSYQEEFEDLESGIDHSLNDGAGLFKQSNLSEAPISSVQMSIKMALNCINDYSH